MPLAAATLQLPGYVVTETLYTGTRTMVYRGQRQHDTMPVVIKLLRQEHPRFSDLVQFRYQYTLTKNLALPAVIKSYSLEPYRNGYALVMEDFGGLSLAAYVKQNERRVSLDQFWSIALQLTDILHSLYQQHIIHKDIKPANILINPGTQQIKLIDFSIASRLPRETQASQHPNELEGTLAYLAPEQTGRMNRGVDYRSDFYALGVTFFELLTGRLPFESTDPVELVHCHLATVPPLAHTVQPTLPEMVSRLVNKLMAKNAEDRYQSALGLKHDLERCRSQWRQGSIKPFELGTRDVCDRFFIPETLYGREQEVEALLAAFERVAGDSKEKAEGRGQKADVSTQPSVLSPQSSAFSQNAERRTQNTEPSSSPHTSHLTPHPPSRSELMLVAGFSGIGKTAVINEVQKPIARQRGYFIKGKYDQFQRNIPFSAFVQAFRALIGQLLSERDDQLEQWKHKLLAALGENGQVMLEVIPELERLIGQQLPVPALSGEAAQNRFNRLFQQFIQVFTAPEHPLVIFIDDLQWADSASLQLMTLLMSAADSQHLLFISAYRDHEVTPAHPLTLTLEAIRQSNTIVNLITLEPLDQSSIQRLVADTLHCGLAAAEPLAALVMSKTKGNPFFSTQFLKALHEEGQIRFNFDVGCWECDIAQVRSLALTNDVVEFMALQLQKLPADTQTVLQLAACIGNQFDLQTLAIVYETAPTDTAAALWKALQDGLILPQSDIYKFYQGQELAVSHQPSAVSHQPSVVNGIDPTNEADVNDVRSPQQSAENVDVLGACTYKFLHDRVQQAAYVLIPETQRPAMHLKIGRLLLKQVAAVEWDDRSFAILNHLNLGSALMVDRAEREALVRLNLTACHHAKLATAYAAAAQYVAIGRSLLPPDPWQTAYDLTLALYNVAAEAAYLTTEFDQAKTLIETIWQQAVSPLDCVKAYELAVQVYIAEDQQVKAIETGLDALQKLGVSLVEWDQSQALPSLPTPAELAQKPTMTNPVSLAALRMLMTITPPVHHVKPALFPTVVLTMLDLCDRDGYAAPSAFAYGSYGLFLGALVGDPEAAHRSGQLSLAILERYPAPELRAKVNMLFAVFVCAYKESGHTTLPLLKQGIDVGLDTGDIEHASYSVMGYFTHLLLTGQPLETVEYQQKIYLELLHKYKQEHCIEYADVWLRSTQQWLLDDHDQSLAQSQAEQLQHFEATQNHQCLFAFHLAALITTYTLGDHAVAVVHAQQAAKSEKAAFGLLLEIAHNFYYSLALLAQWGRSDDSSDEAGDRDAAFQQVAINQTKMQTWAQHAPMNCDHKYALVEAERHRVLGHKAEAMDAYDRAISGAKANDYVQEEALAHELAARFYIDWGKQRLAQDCMMDAYYCYTHWGATTKVAHLEQTYPALLAPILQQHQTSLSPFETVMATKATLHSSTGNTTSSSNTASQALDLAAVLKMSQTLSSEIELEPLLAKLLQAVTQSAGADQCVLLLLQDGEWVVAAVRQRDQSIALPSRPLEVSQNVPIALINAVKRSLQPSIITNAAQHPLLLADPYIQRQQPQSVLCAPILRQGSLLGILYLENNVTAEAFTSDRVELLNLLCSQAAISLENARLYQQSQAYAQEVERSLAALQASENRFQNLAANVPGMIYQFRLAADGSASTPYASPGCLDLYELEAEAVMAGTHSLYAMNHPDDHDAVTQAIARSAQTLTPFEHEWRIVTPSGAVKWIQSVARPERKADDSIVWDGIVIDVSDRKRSEAERKQAEKALKLTQFAIDHASVPIWWIKSDGQIAYMNDAACRDLGYSQTEIVGKYVWDFNPTAVPETWGEHWQSLKEKGSLTFETHNVNQAGNSYPVEVTVNYLEQGDEELNFAFVRNISDRKQAEQERQRLASVVENSTDFIGIATLDGQALYVNPAGRRLVGLDSTVDVTTLHMSAFHSLEDITQLQQTLLPQVIQQGPAQVELHFQHFLTQEQIPVEYNLFVTKDPFTGEPLSLATISRDSRARKQAEAQQQRQAEADQLLAAIAQTINQSVQLDQVLDDCLEQVRQFFQSDRVIICRFDADYNVVIELEALSQPELSLLDQLIDDSCLKQGGAVRYREGYVTACNDAQAPDLDPCYAALLARIQAQASLAVGIREGDQIWGLLVVHYCHAPHVWQPSEIDLAKQLGLQIGIANQKAILHTQLEAELAERRRTETALRLSEERYRCLINVTAQIIWTTDADGQVVEDLPSWRTYTGQSFEAIKKVGTLQALHPDDYERAVQAWTHAVQAKRPYRLEYRVRSVNGTYRYFDVQGVPVLAEDGSIREWIGACVDIDDRKRAEQQLQESQQLLELVLNTIPHKVFWKDCNLVYQGSNSAFAAIVGFSSSLDIIGKSDYDLTWTTAEADWFRQCDRRVIESNLPELGIVETTQQADGVVVWIETSKLPLHDATGNVMGVLGVYQDITDRKQAEVALQQALQEREQQSQLLHTVLDSTEAWVFAKDRNFCYVLANRSYAEAIGTSVEAILGKDDLELGFSAELVFGNPANGIRGFRNDDQIALTGESIHNPYDPATTVDSSLRILDTRKNPLYASDGSVFAMLGFCMDVTDRHHAEAAVRRSEAQLKEKAAELEQTLQELQRTQSQMVQSEKMSGLGQLVAGVAHEINNPVNFIYGNLTHANSYTDDILGLLALYQKHYPTPHAEIETEVEAIDLDFLLEDLPKLLASMRVGAERIQKIVASLRNFSRMDEAEVKAVNLHDGIDSTLMILQHRLKATPEYPGIQITKNYGDLPLVECYAGQLNQVFMNVLSNAIDALEEQMERQNNFQPSITIRTILSEQQTVQMSIADNGPGIPEAVRSRLFDPFFTTKPVGKGTGMGLSISHQIVTEKHGGLLQCVSALGQGTEFIIEIPIQR